MKQKSAIAIVFSLCLALGFAYQTVQAGLFDLGDLTDAAKKIKRASGKVSVEEEIRIGDSVCAQLLGAAPLVKQDSLQQYVNSVGMWVAQQTPRKELPWEFGVIDSENINAFATPGGRVLVTRGLFMALESEAELAGVLGHEISHVVMKHHLNALKKNARLDLLGDALQIAAKDKGVGDQERLDALLNAGTQLYARGLDRSDEYEADRLGVVLAARAGYDPFALLNVLATLDSINPASPKLALLTKTHPSFGDRIEQLDLAIDGRLDKYAMQSHLVERLFKIKQQMTP
ncbi:MAG: M48 family metalloprotease [Gammaproteobacteria bacterium]|nr:M48 family metalloprotease [Gammaproteobacteria bacterium]